MLFLLLWQLPAFFSRSSFEMSGCFCHTIESHMTRRATITDAGLNLGNNGMAADDPAAYLPSVASRITPTLTCHPA